MRKALSLSAALALLVTAGAAAAEPCHYSAPRNVDLDATSLRSVLLNLGATDAHVQGVAGLTKIEVQGTACASNPRWLDDLRIDASRSGSEAAVTARTGNHDNSFGPFGYARYAYLKVSVSVPLELAVAIKSGSGDVVAGSLASLDFRSGSGDLKASEITGALTLEIGSSDVEARRIGGSVQLDSIGSGDVVVDDVTGNLQIGAAGSGDVSIHGVKGTVHVPSRDD